MIVLFVCVIFFSFSVLNVCASGRDQYFDYIYEHEPDQLDISGGQAVLEFFLLAGDSMERGYKSSFVQRADYRLRRLFEYTGEFGITKTEILPGMRVDSDGLTRLEMHVGFSLVQKKPGRSDGVLSREESLLDWGVSSRTNLRHHSLSLDATRELPIGRLTFESVAEQDFLFSEDMIYKTVLNFKYCF